MSVLELSSVHKVMLGIIAFRNITGESGQDTLYNVIGSQLTEEERKAVELHSRGHDLVNVQSFNKNVVIDQAYLRTVAEKSLKAATKKYEVVQKKCYIVQFGDTLSEIAEGVNVAVRQLIRINGIKNQNHILPGQVLRLE